MNNRSLKFFLQKKEYIYIFIYEKLFKKKKRTWEKRRNLSNKWTILNEENKNQSFQRVWNNLRKKISSTKWISWSRTNAIIKWITNNNKKYTKNKSHNKKKTVLKLTSNQRQHIDTTKHFTHSVPFFYCHEDQFFFGTFKMCQYIK